MSKLQKLTAWGLFSFGLYATWGVGPLAMFAGISLVIIGFKNSKCYVD